MIKVIFRNRQPNGADRVASLLRDRALIGIMIYTFARVGAVLQMNVGDYFSQGRRGWVRLHEKGGKEHEASCLSKLEAYLDAYITAAGIAEDKDGLPRKAGIKTRVGSHSIRATGITNYLKSDGPLFWNTRRNYGGPLLPAHHEAL